MSVDARYGIDDSPVFVIDQSRCIGCEACVQACMECGTHRGQSLIHLERIARATEMTERPIHQCEHAVRKEVLLKKLRTVDLPFKKRIEAEYSGSSVGSKDGWTRFA